MLQTLCILNIFLAATALFLAVPHWINRTVLFPLILSLVFYTLWPLAEQVLLDMEPLHGGFLNAEGMFEALSSIAVILLLTFVVMHFVVRLTDQSPPPVTAHARLCTTLLIGFGAVLLLWSTEFQPFKLVDYEENVVASHLTVWIPVAKSFIAYGCALTLYLILGSQTLSAARGPVLLLRCLALSCVPVLLAFMTSDKDPILPLVAALALFTLPYFRGRNFLRFGFLTGAGFFASLIFLLYFSLYRGGGDIRELAARVHDSDFQMLSITAADPGGPYVSLAHEFGPGIPEHLQLDAQERLLSVVPQALLSRQRPDSVDIMYAKFILPRFDIGSGLGFHPMAQAHMDFGPLLAWTYFAVLALSGIGCLLLVRWVSPQPAPFYLLSLVVFSTMLISHRMILESALKSMLTYGVLLLGGYYLSSMLARIFWHFTRPSSLSLTRNSARVPWP